MTDLIFISQSEMLDYDQYSRLPLDRPDLYAGLVFPRLVYMNGGFRPHLDLLNFAAHGKFYNDAPYEQRRTLFNVWNMPGANSLHIPNYLFGKGLSVKVINNFDSERDMLEEALSGTERAPIVAISTTFHLTVKSIKRVSLWVKQCRPDAKIVLGGAFVREQEVNNGPQSFGKWMKGAGVDHVLFAANSERDLADLVKALKNGEDAGTVPNMAAIGGDGRFYVTENRVNPPELEEVPGAWCKIDTGCVRGTVQLRTSYGCPFACAFCSYPRTAGRYSELSNDAFGNMLRSVLRIRGVNKIVFIDDTFNAVRNTFKARCLELKRHNIKWFSFLRANLIDEDLAKLMSDSGCVAVYLGVESASDVVLKNMNKNAKASDFARGIEYLKRNGITVMAAFIIGFPGETDGTIKENIHFIDNSGLDFYTLKEFYYMPHTPVHADRDKYGLSGQGAKWAHGTMDSVTAGSKKLEIFAEVKNSLYVDADTNLWYIAYLYDMGYHIKDILDIQRVITTVTARQIRGQLDVPQKAIDELRTIIGRRK